jgi:hypothetical protein
LSISLLFGASATIVFDPAPSNSSVVEGGTVTFTCVPKVNGSVLDVIVWTYRSVEQANATMPVSRFNETNITGADGAFVSGDERQLIITGVQRCLDGTKIACEGRSFADRLSSPFVYLIVQVPPNFTLPVSSGVITEGQNLTIRLEDVDSGTAEASVSVTTQKDTLMEGTGFSVNRSGAEWSIFIPNVYRNHTGVHTVVLSNVHGRDMANFTLNVVCKSDYLHAVSDLL